MTFSDERGGQSTANTRNIEYTQTYAFISTVQKIEQFLRARLFRLRTTIHSFRTNVQFLTVFLAYRRITTAFFDPVHWVLS